MANICSTTITITGEPEDMSKLYKEFEQALSKSPATKDNGDRWLGNLLLAVGYTREGIDNGTVGIRCRGSVQWYDYDGDCEIVLDTETAWVPMLKCITTFCDKKIGKDKYELNFTTEEPGCEIYYTSSEDNNDWIFDYWGEDSKLHRYDCYQTEDNMLKTLREITGREDETIEELVEIAIDICEDLSIHHYEHAEIEDFD